VEITVQGQSRQTGAVAAAVGVIVDAPGLIIG